NFILHEVSWAFLCLFLGVALNITIRLLEKGDPGKVSAFLFLAPFFGVLSGWVLLGEAIEWYVMLGGLLIFIGIFLVNWRGKSVSVVNIRTKEAFVNSSN
ncbi:EamA family transporter, partial [Halalkalibacter alkalisediminis]|uniref:EamA family transporter n=1 Tax=Halalkalibacter alkalisediminis TaxID=935616 RepID=UPI002362E25B